MRDRDEYRHNDLQCQEIMTQVKERYLPGEPEFQDFLEKYTETMSKEDEQMIREINENYKQIDQARQALAIPENYTIDPETLYSFVENLDIPRDLDRLEFTPQTLEWIRQITQMQLEIIHDLPKILEKPPRTPEALDRIEEDLLRALQDERIYRRDFFKHKLHKAQDAINYNITQLRQEVRKHPKYNERNLELVLYVDRTRRRSSEILAKNNALQDAQLSIIQEPERAKQLKKLLRLELGKEDPIYQEIVEKEELLKYLKQYDIVSTDHRGELTNFDDRHLNDIYECFKYRENPKQKIGDWLREEMMDKANIVDRNFHKAVIEKYNYPEIQENIAKIRREQWLEMQRRFRSVDQDHIPTITPEHSRHDTQYQEIIAALKAHEDELKIPNLGAERTYHDAQNLISQHPLAQKLTTTIKTSASEIFIPHSNNSPILDPAGMSYLGDLKGFTIQKHAQDQFGNNIKGMEIIARYEAQDGKLTCASISLPIVQGVTLMLIGEDGRDVLSQELRQSGKAEQILIEEYLKSHSSKNLEIKAKRNGKIYRICSAQEFSKAKNIEFEARKSQQRIEDINIPAGITHALQSNIVSTTPTTSIHGDPKRNALSSDYLSRR